MTEKQLREALRNCLPDSLPEAQQRAVLSRIRERKQPMKRKVSLALGLTLVLLALGAVAYAVVSRYSVADYSGAGQMTEELQNSILDIDETYENAYMTMTANDVLYDGETVTMAFNFTTKDPDMHLYLYPRLTAEVDGQTYMAFFPAVEEDEAEDEDLGLVILKSIMVDGEEQLSTLDSDEELQRVYDLFMEQLLADEEEDS